MTFIPGGIEVTPAEGEAALRGVTHPAHLHHPPGHHHADVPGRVGIDDILGRVRVEGRAPLSGERLWTGAGSLGFDPADADQIQAGSVLITGHRFGDGNVEVAWWDPDTGRRVG